MRDNAHPSLAGRLAAALAFSVAGFAAAVRDDGSLDAVGLGLAIGFAVLWLSLVALGEFLARKEQ